LKLLWLLTVTHGTLLHGKENGEVMKSEI
jgi:hypothetical protein